ncbi:MAG: nucleotidyltransferase family protein, partial [Candidatus Bathyarchaeia archaeon]
MRSLEEIKRILAMYKGELRNRFKVKEIGIFGSFVRGEQGKRSDIDILVDFEEPPSLFEFMDLEDYLSKLLGLKVDLVTREA